MQDEERNREVARTLLEETGMLGTIQRTGLLDDDAFLDRVSESLTEISQARANQPDVPTRILVGKRHLKFRKAIWTTAVAGVEVGLAALDPSHMTKAALSAHILGYLASLKDLLQKLDSAEMEVYAAIQAIHAEKAADGRMLEAKEASVEEIAARLSEQENLKDVLSSLVAKGAISQVFHDSPKPFYLAVF